ncbi:MAG TPA: hypothetical protein VMB47_05555 [Candidatus Aquilonibacter sp.]|nr:hypothetical protein [Candidatus Aquilonibacter sp.]
MAGPNQRDVNEREREIRQEIRDRGANRQGRWYSRGAWWPILWIWLVIIGIGCFWFVGWGWGSWGGYWRTRVHAGTVPPLSGSGVAIVETTNKIPFVGQVFNLKNVPVQSKVSNNAFWIGPNNKPPTLLIVAGMAYNPTHFNIKPGDEIAVNGVVKNAPAAAAARQNWDLSDKGATRLEAEHAYLNANTIYVTNLARRG